MIQNLPIAIKNFNPLTLELPQHEAWSAQTQHYFNRFFEKNFKADVSALRE